MEVERIYIRAFHHYKLQKVRILAYEVVNTSESKQGYKFIVHLDSYPISSGETSSALYNNNSPIVEFKI